MNEAPKKPYVSPSVVTRSSAISAEKRKRIVELRAEGLSVEVISERLGLHRNTVGKWSMRMGVTPETRCQCGRRVRLEARCYVCRGMRERVRLDAR
jgi:transposase-like protein